jgi:1,4-dihydroxy-6-naphthoate synthase
MLFTLAFGQVNNKAFMRFDEIEEAVLNGQVDAGVIIHENRFTYHQRGLHKLMDLGDHWEQKMQVPIPLGGIVAKRALPAEVITTLDQLIRESLQYAFDRYPTVSAYVKQHAQEMSEEVMRKHIDLYVNNYSLGLGDDGKVAVEKFLDIAGAGDRPSLFIQ